MQWFARFSLRPPIFATVPILIALRRMCGAGRRTRICGYLALAVSVAAVGTARAQTTMVELTLEDALVMARKANRSLVAERARLAQARTNLEMAWSALFPTVTAQGKYTRNNVSVTFAIPEGASAGTTTQPSQLSVLTIQPGNQWDGTIAFSTPLIAPPAYAALEAVKASVESSKADYESSEAAVLFGVGQAYYAAAISEEVVAARQSSIDVARVTLENAQTRFSAGTVTKVDVDRAELALVRAEQAVREARFGREQAYRGLSTLIQARGEFRVVLLAPRIASETHDLDTVLSLRPEFRALQLATQSLSLQHRAYGWRWSPTLSAFGNARIFNYDNFAQQRHSWAVGAELDWVLYDGGLRDAQRHLAAAQARETAAR